MKQKGIHQRQVKTIESGVPDYIPDSEVALYRAALSKQNPFVEKATKSATVLASSNSFSKVKAAPLSQEKSIEAVSQITFRL